MAATVISEWAFASAVGASGEEMDLFLAVCDALRRAAARGRGQAEAHSKVAGLGRWARIFLTRDLCETVWTRPASPEAALAKDILLELIAHENPRLKETLGGAVKDLGGRSDAKEIISTLERASVHWLSDVDPQDFSSRLDYSDIEVFAAPTLILGMAVVLSASETLGIERLTADGKIHPLGRLAAEALTGSYGRLPFLLVLDLGLDVPQLLVEGAVGQALNEALEDRRAIAPDMLQRFAKFSIPASDAGSPDHHNIQTLVDELLTLRRFRARFGESTGPDENTRLVFWIHEVISLMLERDGDRALDVLENLWKPRWGTEGRQASVAIPLPAVSPTHAKLLTIFDTPRVKRPPLEFIADPAATSAGAVAILSPWPTHLGRDHGKIHRRKVHLKMTDRLAWLCGLAIDAKVLEVKRFKTRLEPFLLHFLWSLEFLHFYRGFLGGESEAGDDDRTPNGHHLGWLFKRTLIAGSEALSGDGVAAPQLVMDLLGDFQRSAETFPELGQGERVDLMRCLTNGVVRLIENAIGDVTSVDAPEWLGIAEQALDLHATCAAQLDNKNPGPVVTLRRLLRRYVVGLRDDFSTDNAILETVRKSKWKDHRRLLLAPTSVAEDWIGPGDNEGAPAGIFRSRRPSAAGDDSVIGKDESLWRNVELVRAMQRVIAARADPSLNETLVRDWRTDLAARMRTVSNPQAFDRFVRSKLIQMIADGDFDDDQELLSQAITLSIMYAGPVHLRTLIGAVAGREIRSQEAAEARVSIYAGVTRHIIERGSTKSQETKRRLLTQLKATCLYSARSDQGDMAQFLLEAARKARDEKAVDTVRFRSISARLFANADGNLSAVSEESDAWVTPATGRLVAVDVADGRSVVLHASEPLPTAINSFARNSPGGKRPRLGVVEHRFDDPVAGPRLEVRVAPDEVHKVNDVMTDPPDFGDLVVVDFSGVRPRVLKIDAPSPSQCSASVTPVSLAVGNPRLDVTLPNGRTENWISRTHNFAALRWHQQTPRRIFLSRAETGENNSEEFSAEAMELSDLLIDYESRADIEWKVTLSVHRFTMTDNNDLADVVFEGTPLRLYKIDPAIGLTPGARATLASELSRLRDLGSDPRGLLVTFFLTCRDMGPQLALVPANGLASDAPYPELTTPFDARNLQWREIFRSPLDENGENDADITDRWATTIDGYNFKLEVPSTPPGFQNAVTVNLQTRSDLGAGYVVIEPDTWDPRTGTIGGRLLTNALKLPGDDKAISRAILELNSLDRGDVVELSRITNRQVRSDGLIWAVTQTNLGVLVSSESISMVPGFDPWSTVVRGRKAVVSRVSWRVEPFTPGLDASALPEVVAGLSKVTAYFIAAPNAAPDGRAFCKIAWLVPSEPFVHVSDISIAVPKDARPIGQGSKLEVDVGKGVVHARILRPSVYCDAVWECDHDLPLTKPPPKSASYFGSIQSGDGVSDLFELRNGVFAQRPGESAVLNARLSLKRAFSLGAQQDYLLGEDGLGNTRGAPRGSHVRRCAIKLPNGNAVLAGVTEDDATSGPVRVTGLQTEVRPAPPQLEGRYCIERRLQILEDEPQFQSPSIWNAGEGGGGTARIVVAVGSTLTGSFNGKRMEFKGDLRRRFPDGLPIDPKRVSRGPLAQGESFPSREATCRVTQLEPPSGSFLDVEESSLGKLRALLGSGRSEAPWQLDPRQVRLVYVGRELAPEEEGAPPVWHYLFEWGYGSWMRLPERMVSYQGGSIENAKFILFFGDTISSAEVTEAANERARLVIWSISPSIGHRLYEFSNKPNSVVNLIHLDVGGDGNPEIKTIEGFDPRRETAARSISLPRARLDAHSLEIVRQRQASGQSQQRLLARLDTAAFEHDWGETLAFRHVRMDLDDPTSGLQDGDRFYVQAGEIVEADFDTWLTVKNPSLHDDDVDLSFADQASQPRRILRRAFSLREATLGDSREIDGPDVFKDSKLLVRVHDGRLSLKDGSLPRDPLIVENLLALGQEVLAVYGGPNTDGRHDRLTFELRPGVLVGLDASTIDGASDLFPADLVRFSLAPEGRLRVELASPSDLRFASTNRPVVLLPRQTLKTALPPYEKDRPPWRVLDAFSIGGLPELAASASIRAPDGKPRAMRTAELIAFMERFPKLGLLNRRTPGTPTSDLYFTAGLGESMLGGALVFAPARKGNAPSVRVRSVAPPEASWTTDWHLLSYRDVSAVDLELLVSRSSWKFHDRKSVVWRQGRRGIDPVWYEVRPVSAKDGPLFFDILADRRAALRRRPSDVRRYSVGPGALVGPLAAARADGRSVEAVVAAPHADGLFVELCPGQIVQVPGGVVHHPAHEAPIPLRNLEWGLFGPGDNLTISARPRDDVLAPLEMDMSWVHGPRNAFGPGGAILERDVGLDDSFKGRAGYGVGNTAIVVPSQAIETLPQVAVIGGPEHLSPLSTGPQSLVGRTILLVRGDDGKMAVHGLPKMNIAFDSSWGWENDPFMHGAARRMGDWVSFDPDALLERASLAGGALPFTAEAVVGENSNILVLSRRHQKIDLDEGRMILAVVEGVIPTTGLVQLSVGGRHFSIPSATLLPGASGEALGKALAEMAVRRMTVWVRSAGGALATGYVYSEASALTVVPRAIVGHEDNFLGIICEGLADGRQFWMAAADAAACDLTLPEARRAFPLDVKLKVGVLSSGGVSTFEHPRARSELNELQLGVSIFVDCLPDVHLSGRFWDDAQSKQGWKSVATRSKQSSLMFATLADSAMIQRDAFQAEVAFRMLRNGSPKLLLTGAGARRAVPDGPFILYREPAPYAAEKARSGLFRFLDPDEEFTSLVAALKEPTQAAPAWGAVEHLCERFIGAGHTSLIAGIALCVALDDSRPQVAVAVADRLRRRLMRDIFERALRSLHLEIISNWAFDKPTTVSLFTDQRYEEVVALYRGGALLDIRDALQRWLDAISIEGVIASEEAIANALGVMVGVCRNEEVIADEARILAAVIAATRPVRLAEAAKSTVLEVTTSRLSEIGRTLIDRDYDLPLAPPIAFKRRPPSTEKEA